jgi:hypothetical protein
MPTTIEVPLSINMAQRLNISRPFNARVGFGMLMLWAITMLSIGAAAHFGGRSSDYSAFELLAPS